jgi:hypothetical protein
MAGVEAAALPVGSRFEIRPNMNVCSNMMMKISKLPPINGSGASHYLELR